MVLVLSPDHLEQQSRFFLLDFVGWTPREKRRAKNGSIVTMYIRRPHTEVLYRC